MKILRIIGIGPGAKEELTLRAWRCLNEAELLVGYTTYTALLRPWLPEKEYWDTPMGGEVERCLYALKAAQQGRKVAVVCSGDAGIYGLAGLCLELIAQQGGEEEVGVSCEVVPGVTAGVAASALLGSPLTNDFAVISLSDALTPWACIEQRLRKVAEADLCLCLYNPRSLSRPEHLARAVRLLLEFRPASTACGVARNIGRSGEEVTVLSLGELEHYPADMFTTVIVGNSFTKISAGHLLTERGYPLKAATT